MGKVFVGHAWAEDHHDVFIEDETGRKLAGGRLPEGVDGIARFHALLAGHVDLPERRYVAGGFHVQVLGGRHQPVAVGRQGDRAEAAEREVGVEIGERGRVVGHLPILAQAGRRRHATRT